MQEIWIMYNFVGEIRSLQRVFFRLRVHGNNCANNRKCPLDFLLNGMLSIIIKYRLLGNKNMSQIDFIVKYLSAVVKETFPEFYGT